MTYVVFYYDEENDNRLCKMFNNLDKAKEFSNEHFYSIICVPLEDYHDLSKKLDIKNAFLRDIKDMIERSM